MSVDGEARVRGIKVVLWQILVLNVVVSLAKAAWGVISGSTAMVADGFHSLTDASSNVIALVAMNAASKPIDEGHPYGHRKYESFASAIIGVMLVLVAWRVANESIGKLIAYVRTGAVPNVEVTTTSFVVMFITLGINIFVVWFERRRGKQLDSDVLQSDARHTLSDIWVTLGVIASLVLVRAGVPIADPIVGLFVSVMIAFASIEVFRGVNETFSDKARLDPYEVRDKVLSFEGVRGAHDIRTRGASSFVHMDMSILVDPEISVDEGHRLAEELESWLCGQYPAVKDIVIHVEPDTEEQRARPFLKAE